MHPPSESPGNVGRPAVSPPDAQRRLGWLEDFWSDARHFLRSLLHRGNRSFASMAILTLALGIGSATAIFSVAYGMLYDAYPYADVDEIWSPWIDFPPNANSYATRIPRNFVAAMEKLPAVAEVMSSTRTASAAFNLYIENPNATNNRELYASFQMSANAFAFLGVKPLKGRTILPTDIAENGMPAPVVVLSAAAAQKFFPGDPDPIGKVVPFLNNQGGAVPKTVIGVMPARFGGAPAYDIGNTVWTPLPGANLDAQSATLQVRPRVRLKPGVSKAVAEAQIATLFAEMAAANANVAPFWSRQFPANSGGIVFTAATLPPMTLRQFNTTLRDFASATFDPQGVFRTNFRYLSFGVGFLLVIACMNVANLQLSRAAGRSREIAVRLALGASRSRLIRQLLTESVLLSVAGAALGLFIAYGFTKLTVAVMPSNTFGNSPLPEEANIGLNGTVLLFSAIMAVCCGVLFGLAPALQSTRQDLISALKYGGRGSGAQGGQIRSILVIAEMAFSIMLLVTASLALWGYVRIAMVDPGYKPDRLYAVAVGWSGPANNARTEEFMGQLRNLPFIESVARGAVGSTTRYTAEGVDKDEAKSVRTADVDADFLKTFGTTLIRGRALNAEEISRGELYALVGTTGGNLIWPQGENPIGKRITLDNYAINTPPTTPGGQSTPGTPPTLEVVGIVSNMRPSVTTEPTPFVIVPYTLRPTSSLAQLVVRLKPGQKANVQQEIQALLKAFDSRAQLLQVQDMATAFDAQFLLPRFNFVLFCTLAAIALSLAIAGIYSVLSYHISQRTREFGVRLALGADPKNILGLVLKAGGILLGIGLVVGVLGSYGITQVIANQTRVFSVDLSDYAALAVAIAGVILLSAAAFAACCIPARRAMKVDPLVALRSE